ncbi:sigma-70 family RNA polymerase sigma factor [bacterium]|nr:sigma-70 family RNA polymerase sigma factor [bacterium]
MSATDDLTQNVAAPQPDPDVAALHEVSDRFLRRAARRRLTPELRRALDSVDVAQEVWAGLIRAGVTAGQFGSPGQFRAYLVRAVRSRVVDWVRRHPPAPATGFVGASRPVEEIPAGDPRPSEEAKATDLWEQLLAVCPPEHRPVLTLRRQGLTLHEVATRTGLHEGSVRRILRDLARKVAFHSPDSGGGRP